VFYLIVYHYQRIWDFVALNRDSFEGQMRKMGIGCDWSRFTFTLDDKIIRQAYATFKKMWDESLIYRGERLVNFCTFHGTAFADIEVVFRETKGHLWEISYPLVDGSGEVIVATTRPETMLGDTAVAVNPKDKRYEKFIGKTVKLPLLDREIPIIADDFVDMKFGTGAVKITPAHDPNDFEVGKRHNLPSVSVINFEGKLTDVPAAYRGLTVKEGREKVVADLKKQGFLVKTEDYIHNVGHCYKCDNVIEPLLKEQWFVNMQPLAKNAMKALNTNEIKFYPDSKKTQLVTYLEGLRDWNISRQIAWGIPIPAFQNVDEPDDWIYDERVKEEFIRLDDKTYKRDPDVLDTWFSSSSWPYATLNYPGSDDYQKFYPLSLMETGGEILYPWVSRMIMLGLYVTDKVPFEEVYVHGYVMAEDGAKMSKSIGNVVDPLPVIARYGSDALRMGIISGRSAAVNRGYDQRKVEEARNFCNKLWNVARYIEGIIGEEVEHTSVSPQTTEDHWILSKLQQSQDKLSTDLDGYKFSEAYDTLYHFVWNDVADWYIEASKSNPNKPLLAYLLKSILSLVHPFAPFVSEAIWQTLAWEDSILASQLLSGAVSHDQKSAKSFNEIQAIVSEVRFILKSLKISDVKLYYSKDSFFRDNSEIIKRLSGLSTVEEAEKGSGLSLISTKRQSWLDIDKTTMASYAKQLGEKKIQQDGVIKHLEERLSNKQYIQKAPEQLVEQTKTQLKEAREVLISLNKEIDRFRNI
jgi:valyl-tRNA synthetase